MSYKPYSGTGTVYMATINSLGTITGNWVQVGDAYPLSIQVTTKQTEIKSRMVERAGQIIGSRTAIDTIKGTMTLREWNAVNLATGVSGAYVLMATAGDTVTAAAYTMPVPGEYIQLGSNTVPRHNVSAVTVTSDPAATTYVNGTHYTLDATTGLITSIAGAALAAGTVDVLITYTYAAEANYRVSIGSNVQIRKAIKAHLYDEFREESYIMILDSVLMSASQEINFISEEDSTGEPITFELTLETLSGKSSPGTIDGIPF